jgi:hypothetical protein
MSDDPSYILDIGGLSESPPSTGEPAGAVSRKWVGVRFDCCGIYSRIYRDSEDTAYVGRCPRCQRQVRIAIGPGGTSDRLFRAT